MFKDTDGFNNPGADGALQAGVASQAGAVAPVQSPGGPFDLYDTQRGHGRWDAFSPFITCPPGACVVAAGGGDKLVCNGVQCPTLPFLGCVPMQAAL
jgi:hypothetical protein